MATPEESSPTGILWFGDLEPWMDELYVKQLWFSLGEDVQVKMIRDKYTGMHSGYCFIEFQSPETAHRYLTQLNGALIPGTSRVFKLNWANVATQGNPFVDPEFPVFVGDLGPEVTDHMLLHVFQTRYSSVKGARVVRDPHSGLSKGYGFVRFGQESEQLQSMVEMPGTLCGSRPIRVSLATPKPKQQQSKPPPHNPTMAPPGYSTDPNNTTVFIGGLPSTVADEELRNYFSPYGEILYTKIPPGKFIGFVQYANRESAERAIKEMTGAIIAGSRVRLSWGRPSGIFPPHTSPLPPIGNEMHYDPTYMKMHYHGQHENGFNWHAYEQ